MATDYILPTGQNQGSDPCVYKNAAPGLVPFQTYAPAGSFLRVDGNWAYPSSDSAGVIAKSANFTVLPSQDGAIFNVTTGTSTITVTLPAAATAGNGFSFYVRKADSAAGVIVYSPSQSSEITAAGHTQWVFTDGTSWFIRSWYGSFDSSGNIVITSVGNINLTATTVAVTGATTVSTTLGVTGLATLTGGLTTPAAVTTTGTGTLSIAGTGLITGLATLTGGLTTPANVTTTGTGALSIAGVGTITGLATLTGGLTTPANVTTTGTGALVIAGVGSVAGLFTATGGVTSPIAILSTGTAGIGYATGAGGAVTQLTSRTTGVTINKITGQITMFTAAGSATAATFIVTNSTVAATDTIRVNQASGTNLYELFVTAIGTGSFSITFLTTGGTASDAPVLNFAVIKGVAS